MVVGTFSVLPVLSLYLQQASTTSKSGDSMADSNFQRIRSAVIDGRAQAPRYIQRQLLQLHNALSKNQDGIRQALLHDSGYSGADVDCELYLTSRAIRQVYDALDVSDCLETEYSLARRKDNFSRRVAVGAVYIIPCQHSRLYSTLQPAAAAIAAGNCVMVEVGETFRQTEQD